MLLFIINILLLLLLLLLLLNRQGIKTTPGVNAVCSYLAYLDMMYFNVYMMMMIKILIMCVIYFYLKLIPFSLADVNH